MCSHTTIELPDGSIAVGRQSYRSSLKHSSSTLPCLRPAVTCTRTTPFPALNPATADMQRPSFPVVDSTCCSLHFPKDHTDLSSLFLRCGLQPRQVSGYQSIPRADCTSAFLHSSGLSAHRPFLLVILNWKSDAPTSRISIHDPQITGPVLHFEKKQSQSSSISFLTVLLLPYRLPSLTTSSTSPYPPRNPSCIPQLLLRFYALPSINLLQIISLGFDLSSHLSCIHVTSRLNLLLILKSAPNLHQVVS